MKTRELKNRIVTKQQVTSWLDKFVAAYADDGLFLGFDKNGIGVVSENINSMRHVQLYDVIDIIADILEVEILDGDRGDNYDERYFMYRGIRVFQLEDKPKEVEE